jgi:hypothetical protein
MAFAQATGREENMLKVTGALVSVVAIGGETSGWAIELDSPLMIEGKSVTRLDVNFDASRFGKLENKQVVATGTPTFAQGVETGRRPVLGVATIRELNLTRR